MSRRVFRGLRRAGLATLEWILLFTLILVGVLAGFAAIGEAIVRQHDAVGQSVEGMNFPPQNSGSPKATLAGGSSDPIAP